MNEFWLEGPIAGVAPLLMPAAHTFLQVRHDVPELLNGLSLEQIWQKIGESAPIGFHAIHIAGATDRFMTYARGEQLTEAQLADVRTLEKSTTGLDYTEIVSRLQRSIDSALAQVRATTDDAMLAPRQVGRKLLPTTTIGLIAHAAEHAYRHAGQITTLRKVLER